MALSGRLATNKYSERYYLLTWTATQNIASNTSTISYTLTAEGEGWWAERTLKVSLAGTTIIDKTDRVERYDGTIKTGTITVNHNSDGSKSISGSIQAAVYTSSVNLTASNTFTLDSIPRAATIKDDTPSSINDENSFTVYYSNPAGEALDSLALGISLTGAIDDVPYRSVSKTGDSYSFALADSEKSTLWANTTGSNSRTVYIFLRSIIGGVTYYDSKPVTFTILNPNPTLSPRAEDKSDLTLGLTGNGNHIIKGYNSVYVNSGAAAVKGASITSQSVRCGSKSIASGEGYLDYVESGDFVFTVTDNRGNTVTQTLSKTLIEYFSPICSMSSKATLDTSGEETTTAIATISFEGSFFNSSFGAVNNEFVLEYQFRNINEEYGDTWEAVTLAISGNSYTATIEKSELPYQETYAVRARYRDKIRYGNLYVTEQIIKAVPVFDWSGEDFNFNVPVTIEGMQFGKNNILWEGAALMGDGNVATLSAPISAQPHGVILVFSGFISNAAVNYYISSHVIPKALVAALSGAPHTFLVSGDAKMAYVGAKYLYISDTTITGHADNEATGTGVVSGIAYNNNRWVLRYVIGF